jgi:hypothetical protein
MRGKEKVLGEIGLEFMGYILSRCVSILGIVELWKMYRKLKNINKTNILCKENPFLFTE